MKKMGLIMSKEMELRITFLAIMVLWVQICKSAEMIFTIYHEKNKEKYFKEFQDLVMKK